ncbi:MAG: hypothetical protein J3R72DRAFT_143335 [Linnemannia gamsii]|nr:MAG: hypothetical protein J3R72DRAFT_143335 [Linnemannia gamsii]
MNPTIVSSISRLANYMPLGSYVIYTALETYSFSLGTTPSPITTIIQTPTHNYTCLYIPGGNVTFTGCTADQSNALCISLAIGFFLAVFLSFLKHVPIGGTPPLAFLDDEDEGSAVDDSTQTVQEQQQQQQQLQVSRLRAGKQKKIKYRSGVVYAQGNYYLDFGDYHIWGHAALSFVAFGTLSLFSSSVSQCLFPKVKPWIFVFTQIILLVICCFIAMFWIDDPSLSIGLMVAPPKENHSTQTGNGTVVSLVSNAGGINGGGGGAVLRPGQFAAAATSSVATSTSAFPTMNLAQFNSAQFNASTGVGTATNTSNYNTKNRTSTSSVMMNAPLNMSSSSVFSTTTAVNGSNTSNNGLGTTTTGTGTGTTGTGTGAGGRLGVFTKRGPTMTSVNEKQDDDEEGLELGERQNSSSPLVQGIMIATSLDYIPPPPGSSTSSSSGEHVSVKMD